MINIHITVCYDELSIFNVIKRVIIALGKSGLSQFGLKFKILVIRSSIVSLAVVFQKCLVETELALIIEIYILFEEDKGVPIMMNQVLLPSSKKSIFY